MQVNTLRDITAQFSGRNTDAFIESHLSQYTLELETLLQSVNTVARNFPLELSPAQAFIPYYKRNVGK